MATELGLSTANINQERGILHHTMKQTGLYSMIDKYTTKFIYLHPSPKEVQLSMVRLLGLSVKSGIVMLFL